MRRISRESLRMSIWVALSVLKPWQKRALGLDIERIRNEVADDLTARVMGQPESETVMLRPSLVGPAHSPRHGRWNEDEPHPHPDVAFDD